MSAKTKLSKAQSKRARRQSRDEKGRFAADRKPLRKIREPKLAPVGAKFTEIKTETVTVNGKNYRIPVDDKGNVPKYALAARFTDVTEGTGPGASRRSIQIDKNTYAETTLKGDRLTPEEVKEWWARPNTSDISGIDDPESGMFELSILQSERRKEAQGKIAVVGGTKKDQETVRKMLTESFTLTEQKEMFKNGMTIEIVDLKGRCAGEYRGRVDGMTYLIRVDPDYLDDGDTLLHEMVHHARLTDSKRGSLLTKTRSKDKNTVRVMLNDVSLEEAATVSEALARQGDYKQPTNSGYYGILSRQKKKDPSVIIAADRELYAGSAKTGSEGLKGQRAIRSVEKNFDKSNIADLNLKDVPREDRIKFPDKIARDRLKEIKNK